jgi:hypothetical protein
VIESNQTMLRQITDLNFTVLYTNYLFANLLERLPQLLQTKGLLQFIKCKIQKHYFKNEVTF